MVTASRDDELAVAQPVASYISGNQGSLKCPHQAVIDWREVVQRVGMVTSFHFLEKAGLKEKYYGWGDARYSARCVNVRT